MLAHPDDQPAVRRVVADFLAVKQESVVLEHRLRHAKGHWIWLESRAIVTRRDDSGRPLRITATATDISSRKAEQQQIQRQNLLLQALTRVQQQFFIGVSARDSFEHMLTVLLEASESEYGFIGELYYNPSTGSPYLKCNAITDTSWDRTTHEFFARHAQAGLEFHNMQTLFGAVITEASCIIANDPKSDPRAGGLPSGHPELKAFLGVPLFHGAKLIGMFGVANRPGGYTEQILQELEPIRATCACLITAYRLAGERVEAEVKLRDSETRYRSLFETCPDSIFVLDPTGRICSANTAAARAHGYTIDELLSMRIQDIDVPEAAAEIANRIQRLLAGEVLRFEVTHFRKNGTTFPLEVHTRAFTVQGEQYLVAFDRDISERKQAEAERIELEQRLAQSQRIEAIGRLAGGVAHDFNNLLTIILGNLEIASNHVDGKVGQEAVESIRAASERAARLTQQLLAFSRKAVVRPTPLDFNDIVTKSIDLLKRVIGEDISVTVEPTPSLPSIVADSSQIEQLLMNLVLNARDAMPTGGKLTIQTRLVCVGGSSLPGNSPPLPEDLTEGRYVWFSVTDTGVGMCESVKRRIFEPFFTTKDTGKGTGLGLAVVHGIVEQNHGRVWVESEPGQGTTVMVVFPAATSDPVSLAEAERSTSEDAMQPGTVLLVEDEDPVREIVRLTLENQGYRVLAAHDGNQALRLAESVSDPVQILVTDVIMPGLGGRELAGLIRQSHPGIKVLYMSGYTEDAFAAEGFRAIDEQYIQKPFTPKRLVAMLQELRQRRV